MPLGVKLCPGHAETVNVSEHESQARCPACSALVRGDMAWCSLCHADLRPQPVDLPAPSETRSLDLDAAEVGTAEPAAEPDVARVSVGAGRHRRASDQAAARAVNYTDDGEVPPVLHLGQVTAQDVIVDGEIDDEMVRALLLGDPSDEPLAKVSSRLDTTGKKAAVIIGGGIAVALVLVVILGIVGMFLR